MSTVTGATLLAAVRDVADEPDDGDGTKAYADDDFIYRRLSRRFQRLATDMVRADFPYGKTTSSASAPGASTTVSSPLAILGVYISTGTARYPIPRLVDEKGPITSGNTARYWYPTVASGSATVTINLVPAENTNTVEVVYVPDPGDIASATTVNLPSEWQDLLVYGVALDCCAKRNVQNQMLKDLYNEAKEDAELQAAHFEGNQVVKNTDHLYQPGYEQWFDDRFDWGFYLL